MLEQEQKSDAELIGNYIRNPDGKAMEELIARYSRMVFRTGYRILGNVQDAEDVTQATFIVLATKAASLKPDSNLPAYLHGVARRAALDSLRSRIRRKRKEEHSMDFIQSKSRELEELREVLHLNLDRELQKLSGLQSQAVILRYMQGHSERDAAKIANCTMSAINSRACEGLASLRKRLSHVNPALGVSLIPLLDGESKAEVSSALLSSVKGAVLSAKAGTLVAGGSNANILAKGVLKMMFWKQVKIVSAVILAVASVPATVIVAQNMKTPEKATGDHEKIVSAQAGATTQKTAVPDTSTGEKTVPGGNTGNVKTTGGTTTNKTAVGEKTTADAEQESKNRQTCINNLKQIGLGTRMYSQEHNERFPSGDGAKGLEELRAGGYLENPKMYTCPSTSDSISVGSEITDDNCSYGYKGGLTESTSVDTPLAWDKPKNHKDYGNVLFVDGHAQGYSGEEWLKMQRKWKLE